MGFQISKHDIIRVTGEGAENFLQGQLSADLAELNLNEAGANISTPNLHSLLLSPEGKLVATLRVFLLEEEYILEVASGYGQAVYERLQRFFIGANCEMSLESCMGTSLLFYQEEVDADFDSAPIVFEEKWSEEIVCVTALNIGEKNMPESSLPESSFEYHRIMCGIFKMGAELAEDQIPAEAGKKFIDKHVSFTKGCFVGQELVARIDSRGSNTPMKLVYLKIDESGNGVEQSGSEAEQNSELFQGDKSVGTLVSSVGIPERYKDSTSGSILALAYVKRNVENGAECVLKSPKTPEVELKAQVVALNS